MEVNPADKEPCAVLFSEFMDGVKSTQESKRLDGARTAIAKFCENYIREHSDDFTDTTPTAVLAEKGESSWKNHSDPAVRLRMDLETMLILFMESGDKSHLTLMENRVKDITAKF
ncbi:hypothetical protein FHETE_8804 [Fusarium heterosporum]|uniref:Uncharacterized protein n=1 Tax=Fusarium heterosporum TaxID=42747 RepID=A0A8H5WFI9_FUSHE|nr:hypothetical protein FHETE_8804 [Fusarium heterosporum]